MLNRWQFLKERFADAWEGAEEQGHKWHVRLSLVLVLCLCAGGLVAFVVGAVRHAVASFACGAEFDADELAVVGGGMTVILAGTWLYRIAFDSYYRNYRDNWKKADIAEKNLADATARFEKEKREWVLDQKRDEEKKLSYMKLVKLHHDGEHLVKDLPPSVNADGLKKMARRLLPGFLAWRQDLMDVVEKDYPTFARNFTEVEAFSEERYPEIMRAILKRLRGLMDVAR
jgi:hypothetical protein